MVFHQLSSVQNQFWLIIRSGNPVLSQVFRDDTYRFETRKKDVKTTDYGEINGDVIGINQQQNVAIMRK